MDFGMLTDFHVRPGGSQPEAFEESFRQVDVAETLGMDSVWLGEHHFTPDRSVLASPLTIASTISARTERLRIGLVVQVLPLGNPLRMAEETATVDQISKGRLDFGIGRSGLTRYYEGYNVPYGESRARFIESLDIIMKAWTQERFSHDGEYHSFHDVTVVPKPYQRPHPPIRVAVASADTFALMGGRGFPIFASANTPVSVLQERLSQYRQARREAGHPGDGDVALRIPAYVGETAERARSEPRASTEHGVAYAASELIATAASEEVAERMRQAAETPYEELLKRWLLYGTPQEVTERLAMLQDELGISGVVLEMNYGSRIPYDRVVNSIRLLTEKVMPNFK